MILLFFLVLVTGLLSWAVDRGKPPRQISLFCVVVFVVVSVVFTLLLLQDPGGLNLSGLR